MRGNCFSEAILFSAEKSTSSFNYNTASTMVLASQPCHINNSACLHCSCKLAPYLVLAEIVYICFRYVEELSKMPYCIGVAIVLVQTRS